MRVTGRQGSAHEDVVRRNGNGVQGALNLLEDAHRDGDEQGGDK